MNNTYLKNIFKSNILILIIVFLFSFLINFYYSSLGAFPIDTFFHFDSSARILKGEIPIRDFWIVSGFVIDFIQSLFFKLFDINWIAYVFHSSLFNFFLSVIIFYFFLDLNIEKFNSFLFTCFFSILAYTISGTPFVDHHAIFFLLISTILIIKTIELKKDYLWFFIILFFYLSFFTKQVPATYAIITQAITISIYIIKERKFKILKYIISNFLIITLIFLSFLIFLKINLKDFYIQYIDHPRFIGSSRIDNLNLNLNTFFNNYKFIFLPLIIIIFLKINRYLKNNLNIFNKDFYKFLILTCFLISSLFHQVMTKNQIYIYFFIPILCGVLLAELKFIKHKSKNLISLLLIFSLFLVTFKYHLRYNETRKFHELENVNFREAVPAKNIDKRLIGLKWINPFYKGKPIDEILIIKRGIKYLDNEDKQIMLISHYLFLDSITKKNLNYPTRSFTVDGASMPIKGMKHYKNYQNYFIKKIKKNNVEKIYFFKHENIDKKIITNYLSANCFTINENEIFFIYNLKCSKPL